LKNSGCICYATDSFSGDVMTSVFFIRVQGGAIFGSRAVYIGVGTNV